jgi:hypothetical protein
MILAESLFTDLDRPPVEGFGLARCGKPRRIAAIIRARRTAVACVHFPNYTTADDQLFRTFV